MRYIHTYTYKTKSATVTCSVHSLEWILSLKRKVLQFLLSLLLIISGCVFSQFVFQQYSGWKELILAEFTNTATLDHNQATWLSIAVAREQPLHYQDWGKHEQCQRSWCWKGLRDMDFQTFALLPIDSSVAWLQHELNFNSIVVQSVKTMSKPICIQRSRM